MTLAKARADMTRRVVEHWQENQPEASDKLNNASRRLVEAMAEEHGTVFLGNVNLYDADHGKPVTFRKYPDGEMVYNFQHGFVVPTDDAELRRLIEERDQAEYTGTNDDYERVTAISDRLEAIGGQNLHWS